MAPASGSRSNAKIVTARTSCGMTPLGSGWMTMSAQSDRAVTCADRLSICQPAASAWTAARRAPSSVRTFPFTLLDSEVGVP